MRFSTILALLAVFAVSATEARAQRDDQFVWGLGAGATIPSGWAKDNHDVGGHGLISFGIGAVDSPFGIRFDGMYSFLGDADNTLVKEQGKARAFNLMANGVFNIYGSNRHVYAVTGLGGFWYNPDGQGTTAVNDFALNAGLGVFLPGIHGFVEAKWVNLYRALPDPVTGLKGKKSARLYPITLGIMF
jgi:hypothetical protein